MPVLSLSLYLTSPLSLQVILDHHNEEPHSTHPTFEAYAQALHDEVVTDRPDRATRPWILVSHSHGSTGAYGIGRLLGRRLRRFIVLGRRPPHVELLEDVFGVTTIEEIANLSLHTVAQTIATTYVNPAFAMGPADADESKWAEPFVQAAKIAKDQYSSACSMCGAAAIEAYFGNKPGAELPPAVRLSAPILAVVSSRETSRGETREKAARWAELTTGACTVEAVDCEHMGLPTHDRAIKLVLEALEAKGKA